MRGIFLVAVLSLVPALSRAQTDHPAPPPESTVHRHLGFFLRLDGGVGYLGSSTSLAGIDASMFGVAIPFGIAIGGAVTENFILAGDLWGIAAVTPSFKLAGQTTAVRNSSFGLSGIGLNLTYYFMPANIYVSATPSLVGLSLRTSGTDHDSQTGFGLSSSRSSPRRPWRSASSITSASIPGDRPSPSPRRHPTCSTPARATTVPTSPSRSRRALDGQAQPRLGGGRLPLAGAHAA